MIAAGIRQRKTWYYDIPMDNNDSLTITRLAIRIRNRKISPVEITQFCLDRIRALQPKINAFITVTSKTALKQAAQAEKEIMRGGYKGPLHGIPVSLKDLFDTAGIRTTAGSNLRRRYIPKKNAALVHLLLEQGCILLGKTNMHEFAYGPTNRNPHYGDVLNPWNTQRISGGSSGGSAAAVVTGQCIASFGTDTGGSIRIPSAACGCVGFKPTYGSVSMEGVFPLSYSLDHAGPICRSVRDAALLFEAVKKPDNSGISHLRSSLSGIRKGVKGLVMGIPRQYFFDHLETDVQKAVHAAIRDFERLGAEIREVDLKSMKETAGIATDITAAEALAVHKTMLERKPEAYGEDVRQRLLGSNRLSAVALVRRQQEARKYREMFDDVLKTVDLLLAPTLPIEAPRFDRKTVRIGKWRDGVRTVLLSLTRPANITGLPAISIPCGFSTEGLPIGLQVIGRRFDEATLLRAAFAYEQATPWHGRFPAVA